MIITRYISSTAKSLLQEIGQWRLVLIIILMSLCMATPVCAAEDSVTTQDSNAANAESKNNEDKQCTWACLKWDKICNVDPRGVYKCRRMCANFGEVCEE